MLQYIVSVGLFVGLLLLVWFVVVLVVFVVVVVVDVIDMQPGLSVLYLQGGQLVPERLPVVGQGEHCFYALLGEEGELQLGVVPGG